MQDTLSVIGFVLLGLAIAFSPLLIWLLGCTGDYLLDKALGRGGDT